MDVIRPQIDDEIPCRHAKCPQCCASKNKRFFIRRTYRHITLPQRRAHACKEGGNGGKGRPAGWLPVSCAFSASSDSKLESPKAWAYRGLVYLPASFVPPAKDQPRRKAMQVQAATASTPKRTVPHFAPCIPRQRAFHNSTYPRQPKPDFDFIPEVDQILASHLLRPNFGHAARV